MKGKIKWSFLLNINTVSNRCSTTSVAFRCVVGYVSKTTVRTKAAGPYSNAQSDGFHFRVLFAKQANTALQFARESLSFEICGSFITHPSIPINSFNGPPTHSYKRGVGLHVVFFTINPVIQYFKVFLAG